MIPFATILVWLLMGLALGQALLVLRFVLALCCWKRILVDDDSSPKAAVILCLRGGDPFLSECINGLLAQDYPRFDVHIVVDHRDDPANSILSKIIGERSDANIHIQYLDPTIETCSLKCNSVVQAARSLDDSVEFIAQLDADTIPHTTWLRELATALADDDVGAATGNRWYMPADVTIASLIRYVWNAAAVVQMHSYCIAWGGTLAVKTKLLRETDLLDRWSKAFCEDTMLFSFLKKEGLRIEFVPSLMMINRESCDLGGFVRWVRRQLLTAKLYHPAWLAVLGHAVVTTVVPVVALALLVWAYFSGDTASATWLLTALICYQLVNTLVILPIEFAVRRIVSARGEPTRWMVSATPLLYALAVPLTQLVYAAAMYSTCRLRSVDWRGVHYQIDGPWQIQRGEYRPYEAESSDSAASL